MAIGLPFGLTLIFKVAARLFLTGRTALGRRSSFVVFQVLRA